MIDAGAFYDCQLLTKITVPASVEYVGRTAFKRNDVVGNGLETLTFEGNAPEILYTSEYVGYSLDGLDGVTVNVYEDTSGWDSEVWTILNLNKIAKIKEVTEIKLDKTSVELKAGETTTVIATVVSEDAIDKTVTWTSSDESIATVENGVITAVAEGTATITASCGDVTAAVTVTVNKKDEPVLPPKDVTDIFIDVNEGAWYKDAVQYVFDEGLMSGNGEYFTPVKNMTRA